MNRWLAAALLTLTACTPVVTSTPIGEAHPPRHAEAEVQLYSVRAPECAFEEISLLSAHISRAIGTASDALQALKRQARQVGADAIVGLNEYTTQGTESVFGVRGTAVRFVDAECRR